MQVYIHSTSQDGSTISISKGKGVNVQSTAPKLSVRRPSQGKPELSIQADYDEILSDGSRGGKPKYINRHMGLYFTGEELATILKFAIDKKLLKLNIVLTDLTDNQA
jgi:hypothetical protein